MGKEIQIWLLYLWVIWHKVWWYTMIKRCIFSARANGFPAYLPGCPWPFHSICAFWCFLLLQPPSTCQKCHPGLCLCIQPWSGQTPPAVSPRQPKRRPSLVGKTDPCCVHCGQYFLQFCSLLRSRVWNANPKSVISHRIYSMFKDCQIRSLNLFDKIKLQHYQCELHTNICVKQCSQSYLQCFVW